MCSQNFAASTRHMPGVFARPMRSQRAYAYVCEHCKIAITSCTVR